MAHTFLRLNRVERADDKTTTPILINPHKITNIVPSVPAKPDEACSIISLSDGSKFLVKESFNHFQNMSFA